MKKTFLITLILIFFKVTLCAQDTIRVLAIGNSFSEDAVENYLYDLGKNKEIVFIIANMYIGSCSLETHWNNAQNNSAAYSFRKINAEGIKSTTQNVTLLQGLTNEKWDYISFQQNSGNSGMLNTYFPYLSNLLAYAKTKATNENVKYMFHQTWAYASNSTHSDFAKYGNNQETMYNAIISTVTQATAEAGINIVVPSGTAVQNGRSSFLGDTFCRDGYHLNLGMGRFTAACTWFEILTGLSVLNNDFIPSSVTKTESGIVKEAAHNAVLNPNSVTSMQGNIPVTTLTAPVNIDFGNVTATSTQWNYLISYSKGNALFNLTDSDGKETGIVIEVYEGFAGVNTSGPTTTTTLMNMPSDVSRDCFWSDALGTFSSVARPRSGFRLSNMNKDATYKFSFFASRMSSADNRETLFTVNGTTQATAVLNASNNSSNIVTVSNIRPTQEGTISIKAEPGPNNNNVHKFYYINALQIQDDSRTGIKNNKALNQVSVFPNPFTASVHISCAEGIKKTSVFSLSGSQVLEFQDERIGKNEFYMETLPKGTYILKINDLKGETFVVPVMKK